MNDDRLMEIFLTWQFGVAAIAIAAVVDRIKKVTRSLLPKHKESELLKSVFTCMNIVLGIGIAAIPSFLPGERFSHRMLVGICAGFLSNFAYGVVLKRFSGGGGKSDTLTSNPNLPAITSPPVSTSPPDPPSK